MDELITAPASDHNVSIWMVTVTILFLFLGTIIGYFLGISFPPKSFISTTCTPRPICLDAQPPCLIPETPDMCPPSVTSTPTPVSPTKVFTDELDRYQVTLPTSWTILDTAGFNNSKQFQAPDGSIFVISVLETTADSLTDYLAQRDKSDLVSWEGQPGKQVVSSKEVSVYGLPAVERSEHWLSADFITVNTYSYINRSVYSFYIIPLELPYDQTEVYREYYRILSSFLPAPLSL